MLWASNSIYSKACSFCNSSQLFVIFAPMKFLCPVFPYMAGVKLSSVAKDKAVVEGYKDTGLQSYH